MAWSSIFLAAIFHLYLTQTNAQDYRLPEIYVPSKYVVDLTFPNTIFAGTSSAFTGKVAITFRVTTSTTEIKLHTRSTPDQIDQTQLSTGTTVLTASKGPYDATTEILTITVSTALNVLTDYVLEITYSGELASVTAMRGAYISTYSDESNNTNYMISTQFEPTHARHAFPCFDEPNFKATFVISLTYPSTLNVLGNTPSETVVAVDATNTKTTFKETTKMSTYLVAFAVSGFTCTEGETIETGVPHRVCSRNEETPNRAWALEIGTPIMRVLEDLTGIKYGTQMTKMDEIAIPDFSSGAMENWGLVTYRETGLLFSDENSSNNYKKSIALVIAHEFTHMWFGNLVTCKWWDYTFLNEGFARFYQYFAAALTKQLSDWELDKHFNVEQVHTALLADSTLGAQALTSTAVTPSEISNKFGTITYNKGASILRMIETNIMGANNFIYGIQSYLKTYSSQGAIPANLWTSLTPFVPGVALPGVTFSAAINNWVENAGHPVVKVSKDGNNVILTQTRFLLSGSDSASQYYVPVTYTTSSDITRFANTTVQSWLTPSQTLTLTNALSGSDWIILNNRQSGFYRVNYDSTLWAAIKTALHSNHLQIDVLNRAQLVSDAYNFARSKANNGTVTDVSYSDVFSLLSYLEHETDYYPWYAAIIGNNHLLQRIGYDSTEGIQFTSWMLKLLQAVYATVPFDTIDSTNQVYTMKQIMILTRVCKYGEEACINKSKELFANYRNNGVKVPKNLRGLVYCNALRHSTDIENDYNFLWQKYQETKLMHEILTIFSGLGCTEDITLLKRFLRQSITPTSGIRYQDFTSVWSYVYSSSKIGASTAMEFITENYVDLTAYYSGVGSLISNIAGYYTSEDQLEKLEALINNTIVSASHKATATSALNTAKANIEWASLLKSEVTAFLSEQETGGTAIYSSSLVVVFVTLLLHKILF